MDENTPKYRGILHDWPNVVGNDSHDNGPCLDGIQAFGLEEAPSFPIKMIFIDDHYSSVAAADTMVQYKTLISFGWVPLDWVVSLIRREFKNGRFNFVVT